MKPFAMLIGLLLSAIVAAATPPIMAHFTNVEVDNDCGSISRTANTMSEQIELYRSQHDNHVPSLARFYDQMRKPTNAAGETSDGPVCEEFPLGPYVGSEVVNPVNGISAVGGSPSKSVGWVYLARGNQFIFWPVDENGKLFDRKLHQHKPARFR